MKIRSETIILWVLSIISIVLVLKTSDDPLVGIFNNSHVQFLFQKLSVGNVIIFNLSVGFIVSVIFYQIVFWLPDRRRRSLIKKNIKERYKFFKEDTISILLSACQRTYEGNLPEKLTEQYEFRTYFKVAVNGSQNRWHAVQNGINDQLLKDILVELELFMNEVSYVLNNIYIDDPEVFMFFKRLSMSVYKLKNTTMEDENNIRQVFGFLWDLFAGWSYIEGYRSNDIVAVMIEEI